MIRSGMPSGNAAQLAVEGVPEARVLVNTARTVRAFAVYELLMDDGCVELIGIELDTGA